MSHFPTELVPFWFPCHSALYTTRMSYESVWCVRPLLDLHCSIPRASSSFDPIIFLIVRRAENALRAVCWSAKEWSCLPHRGDVSVSLTPAQPVSISVSVFFSQKNLLTKPPVPLLNKVHSCFFGCLIGIILKNLNLGNRKPFHFMLGT